MIVRKNGHVVGILSPAVFQLPMATTGPDTQREIIQISSRLRATLS